MNNLNSVQVISFFADEFINSCGQLKENLSDNELSDMKCELMYHMVKAVKAEVGFLGIKPPNKISVTSEDVFERTNELVAFEKSNQFPPLNDRASKDFKKAINGTYKTWIK